jgi:hypothetical protein
MSNGWRGCGALGRGASATTAGSGTASLSWPGDPSERKERGLTSMPQAKAKTAEMAAVRSG